MTSEGSRAAFVPGVREPREILLADSVPVRFRWRELASIPDVFVLRLILFQQEPGMPELSSWIPLAAEPGSSEVVHLPAAGPSRLEWRIGRRQPGGSTSWSGEDRFTQSIDVPDRAEVQEIEISMPAEVRAVIEAGSPAAGGG